MWSLCARPKQHSHACLCARPDGTGQNKAGHLSVKWRRPCGRRCMCGFLFYACGESRASSSADEASRDVQHFPVAVYANPHRRHVTRASRMSQIDVEWHRPHVYLFHWFTDLLRRLYLPLPPATALPYRRGSTHLLGDKFMHGGGQDHSSAAKPDDGEITIYRPPPCCLLGQS